MENDIRKFFREFRQEYLAGAESNSSFQLAEFLDTFAKELIDTGFVDDFEFCHYRGKRGLRVDGFWFGDDGELDLYVADFENAESPTSLTATDIDTIFRRSINFFEQSRDGKLHPGLEETSPEYGLAREICDRGHQIRKINFILVSERVLSERVDTLETRDLGSCSGEFHVWDISRLQRQRESRSRKEALDIDIVEQFGAGIPCLPAHTGTDTYKSYLLVVPGAMLASMYEKYGARLLEQNVRSFLQARGRVNKGIRETLLNEPGMFFAYNNGITATAREVDMAESDSSAIVGRIRDLQIVNGGQTTASLFHTRRKDEISLEGVFVQMKLTVLDSDDVEHVVPKISEYANTQNRVNAADFFSNHPFHIRMEEFSRRLWAPAKEGEQRETRWFYERARGQYADAQSTLSPAARKKFQAIHPKRQMFSKTDLAKFENVFDEDPVWVNRGAQKNFSAYAKRIGQLWKKQPDDFNEEYFRRAIARAILFRFTEKQVSSQPWYNGGYRANIVAYTLAMLSAFCRHKSISLDYARIWNQQEVYPSLAKSTSVVSRFVNDDISQPPAGISNISEWCKKDVCWQRLAARVPELEEILPAEFLEDAASIEDRTNQQKHARKVQKVDNGIEAQTIVLKIGSGGWSQVLTAGNQRSIFTPKELGLLQTAARIPTRIPTEKQSIALLDILEKAKSEGIRPQD
ncbi:AIPR family protein [Salinisphaera sp.]|uniref:AIPR family protein n=1 Tax=Salinisphaera sp. TaxID=1914330 RepID=UPI000C6B64B9|nr:AIPR family protein [Salinisphaera sp.]MAS11201.1 AIPR family protein [Salinisphaera sp.]|tara:strand:+ start:9644 stop:11713 length:2070 start_codon:yes stop_codon:yes gene_type:complete